MSSQEKYVCSLDAASIKKAEKELNETAKEREGAVETLRQWVKDNSSWLKSPTDTRFLLSILRPSKFVQLAARKRLVKFWHVRTKHGEWFADLDTHDPELVKIWRTGCNLGLPKPDKNGRSIFINRAAGFDPTKVTIKQMMRASVAYMDLLLLDENLQVNGMQLLLDFTDMTMKHQMFYSPENTKKSMEVYLQGFSARYKSVNYYNTNPFFDVIFAIVHPLLPEKMKKRLHFHGKNLAEVYKQIDQSCLPREYLPDDYSGECIGSIQDIVEQRIKQLQTPEARDYIRRLSGSGYGITEAKKPSDEELFTESFRKLNIE